MARTRALSREELLSLGLADEQIEVILARQKAGKPSLRSYAVKLTPEDAERWISQGLPLKVRTRVVTKPRRKK
jgi:hypothetical protein